ncbi:DUF262 domain-containing protein [Candidatus Nanosalina sp. VS9-1]|uniref:GmrSD restriction endonuclease domain-containing protein n=1 Tax=Candidatus Nanosalina sp. VS9-1 TaxID=3388566 RepID=UPI0039E1ADC1
MSKKVNLKPGRGDLSDIVQNMEKGIYRIPQFQREYVWDRTEVVDLLDSVYHHFPIGSFFLWKAPKDKWGFFRRIEDLDQPDIDSMAVPEINFVLDGQQRLTSLYAVLKGKDFGGTDYSRIVFDLDKEEFKVADGKASHLVKVSEIWNDKKRIEIINELEGERQEALLECRDRLKDYPISTISVDSGDLDEVIDIFERINQKGTRLGRFDIVNANVWDEDFDLRERIDEDLMEKLDDKGFGEIDRGAVTQALALNIEGNCSTSTQRNLETEKVKENWKDTKDAIIRAVNYLQNNLGVKQASFIPYEGMIPVLSYYMFETENHSIEAGHKTYIDRWFWQTAVSGRYSSSTQTTMTDDRKLFDRIIAGEDVEIDFPPQVNKEKLISTNIKKSSSGLRNVFLCILAKTNPKHFEGGGTLTLDGNYFSDFKIDHHHIFPNSFLKGEGFSSSKRKSIMDITFIPKDLNRNKIRDTKPSEYFGGLKERLSEEQFEDRMSSHMMPYGEDSGIWEDDYNKFLEKRAELFLNEINRLIGSISDLESDLDTEPQEVISETETRVRDYLHRKMRESYGEDYWDKTPQDVKGRVKGRVRDDRKKNPNLEIETGRDRLDYCNIMDYVKIINTNYDLFNEDFPSKAEVENRFGDFSDFRNAVNHERDPSEFVRKDGEIAIKWILSCIREES